MPGAAKSAPGFLRRPEDFGFYFAFTFFLQRKGKATIIILAEYVNYFTNRSE